MELTARRQPPTVRLRRLASELRQLRSAAGLTREDVSEQTNINSATLYRIETARVRPQKRTLLALLDKYGVTDEDQRSEMVALSRQATQLGWLQQYESELPEQYSTYISFEAEARSVRDYESQFIPGLLQTEAYTRALLDGSVPLLPADKVQPRIEARLQRQVALTKKPPLQLWAILDEAVLHRTVGGAEVMAEQLNRLIDAARQPHITLQVIPFDVGAHPGMSGPFAIMDFPDKADPELVYTESMAGELFLERDSEVRRYATMFEHLRALALSPNDSGRAIKKRIDALP
jgi:transcriptional regulator with XRE-family HTH domain